MDRVSLDPREKTGLAFPARELYFPVAVEVLRRGVQGAFPHGSVGNLGMDMDGHG